MGRQFSRYLYLLLSLIFFSTGVTGCGLSGTKTLNKEIDLNKVQRISYDASKEYQEALDKYNAGCEGAKIIRDDESLTDKQIALVLQGAEDSTLVERAIELLEDHGIKATFAVTAVEAAEDDNTIKLITDKGHELVDNGLNGNGDFGVLPDEEIIYELASSRKVFSTLTNITPSKLLLDSPYYTQNICMAAEACGYSKLVAPSPGKYINEKSFANSQKASEYVARLKSGSILVFKLNGIIDALEIEPKVEYKKPAIDKQPSIDSNKAKKSDENNTITVLTWVIEALEKQECKIVKLDRLKALTDKEYVASLVKDNANVKAEEVGAVDTLENVAALVFKGVPEDESVVEEILGAMKNSESGATFFINSNDIDNYRESIEKIYEGGYSIACRGSGEDYSQKEVYDIYVDISEKMKKIQKDLAIKVRYFMPDKKAGDNLSYACNIAGASILYFNNAVTGEKGSINCFDLTKNTDVGSIKKFIASCKGRGIQLVDVTNLILTENSMPEIDEKTLKVLREDNNGRLAYQRNMIYTSEKAMSLTFYGVSNERVVKEVLSILSTRGYKGTFFATFDEITNHKETIRSIVDSGNELGIAYIPKEDDDFDPVVTTILGAQAYAKYKYDVEPTVVFHPYGKLSEQAREAISAAGCSLAGYEYALVQSKYKEATGTGSFYGAISGKIEPHRGSISYFNMNYFAVDKDLSKESGSTLLGKLLKTYIDDKIASLTYKDGSGQAVSGTAYRVKTFSSLAYSSYTYSPGRTGNNLISMSNSVLGSMTTAEEQNAYMISKYVGNPDVSEIPGFATVDKKKFDVTGKVTGDRVIFLTFDDWGYEKDINELLYVLDKYDVKGNFFVRTNNVKNNPNLLRAIADEGHLVGSHSNSHMAAWYVQKDEAGNYSYSDLTPEDATLLRQDVVTSFDILNKYIGDVVVNGRKSLTTIYRPPTLAVSRAGMYQIYDVGFSYIVNGDFSTADYNAQSVDSLIHELRHGMSTWYGKATVGNGTCLVMHMSPNAQYTAEALDVMIPEWQNAGYTIARLDDYLR